MTEDYRPLGSKDRSLLWTGVALGAALLSLPWLVHQASQSRWLKVNPFKAVEADLLYDKALETGWEAAVAVQTAQGRQEWEQVVTRWNEAIALLEGVQDIPSVRTQEAQAKLAEYRQFQQYASQQAAQALPEFAWETVTDLSGQLSFVLVDPDRNDSLSPGPRLEIGPDQTIVNTAFVNDVLASLNLPPVPLESITPGQAVQLRSNEYIIANYPMGELSLHRTLCTDSFAINNRYDCLWKITLR